jgi:protein farnesyltransferase subunit beta
LKSLGLFPDAAGREKMYNWFMSLKQRDGSFIVSNYGEVDVRYGSPPLIQWTISLTDVLRGIYCLLVVAHLLDIVTPELVDGTAAFIASCQTYEGGFSSASHPHIVGDVFLALRPSLGEAHGGYTFCALASWVLLRPYGPADDDAPRVDTRRLLRWLVNMQGSEIEIGGFKGRTNKLVDGCYSWWVGGAFALLEALGIPESTRPSDETTARPGTPADDGWDDVDGAFRATDCRMASGVNELRC